MGKRVKKIIAKPSASIVKETGVRWLESDSSTEEGDGVFADPAPTTLLSALCALRLAWCELWRSIWGKKIKLK